MKMVRALELCESRGDRSGLPVPNKPYSLCGREAALNFNNLKRAWEGPRNQSFSLRSGVNGDWVSHALRILLVHVPALPDGREVESFFSDTLTNQPP